MVAAQRRASLEQRERISLTEWQARTVCTFIAAQAGLWMNLKRGERNPIMDAALRVSILGDERGDVEKTPEEAELDAMRGEKVADDYRDDPRLQQRRVPADPVNGVEASNPVGSFEQLMSGWGASSHGQALDTTPARQ